MDKVINVLVFPAGEINSIELHDALATSVNVKVFGASSLDRHGPYVFKNYISGLPLITEPNFLEKLNKLINDHDIKVIFPTHDTVAEFMTNNHKHIKAKIVGGDSLTAEICRDKQKTYDLFSKTDFVPKIYNYVNNIDTWPLFTKPRAGQGGVGARIISSQAELDSVDIEDNVVTEYLPGDELTVDCFTDKDGKLLVVSPRSRDRLLAGVSVAGTSQPATDEVKKIAATINEKLKFNGLWYFQLKKDSHSKYKLLEISTRVAGTMCLTRVRGANLALLSVYAVLGYDVEPIINVYNVKVDRTLISRYKLDYDYDTVYFDFDDTLIIKDKVHLYSIMFLYQCKNQGKKVVLLTRHEKDIHQTLAQYKIDPQLFDQIIHINFEQDKLSKIVDKKAIFVDNSFQERKLIHKELGIPVFDVDAIEALLDWRT